MESFKSIAKLGNCGVVPVLPALPERVIVRASAMGGYGQYIMAGGSYFSAPLPTIDPSLASGLIDALKTATRVPSASGRPGAEGVEIGVKPAADGASFDLYLGAVYLGFGLVRTNAVIVSSDEGPGGAVN